MEQKPSLQPFVDMINSLTGQETMTPQKMNQFLQGAKRRYDKAGMDGFINYLQKMIQAPVSDDYIKNITNQMKTPEGLKDLVKNMDVPLDIPVKHNNKKVNLRNRKKGN
ncbi:hypothetical protein IC620_01425 [Hazenella sp. IB182357]|uniref:Uncharacterized protein n=1 Tax=Polycladospora coralii TaxID=2771432 RepID=A0A926N8Y0_9BACL|nr:hypothetical protein [Polycladospora coralii]MBD1371020.1 hypothetical protein [Polycladospora coralii]MBS7529960.1 hypothetical protein [Polycladospora coralii]